MGWPKSRIQSSFSRYFISCVGVNSFLSRDLTLSSPGIGQKPHRQLHSSGMQMAKLSSEADPFSNINKMQTIDATLYVPRGPLQRPATFDFEEHVAQAWQHWEAMGKPRWVMAPMVDQSELAFRHMGRKYGCDLCYTPMLHSKIFSETPKYRREHFQTDATDRPLVAQFCANNPDTLLRAATMVADRCDAVDINFGCPQDIARRGRYGAFLMDDPDRVHDLILTLKASASP